MISRKTETEQFFSHHSSFFFIFKFIRLILWGRTLFPPCCSLKEFPPQFYWLVTNHFWFIASTAADSFAIYVWDVLNIAKALRSSNQIVVQEKFDLITNFLVLSSVEERAPIRRNKNEWNSFGYSLKIYANHWKDKSSPMRRLSDI